MKTGLREMLTLFEQGIHLPAKIISDEQHVNVVFLTSLPHLQKSDSASNYVADPFLATENSYLTAVCFSQSFSKFSEQHKIIGFIWN